MYKLASVFNNPYAYQTRPSNNGLLLGLAGAGTGLGAYALALANKKEKNFFEKFMDAANGLQGKGEGMLGKMYGNAAGKVDVNNKATQNIINYVKDGATVDDVLKSGKERFDTLRDAGTHFLGLDDSSSFANTTAKGITEGLKNNGFIKSLAEKLNPGG